MVKFDVQGEMIKAAVITWTFSENFTELTLQSYDENADKALSKNEAWKVQKSILDYVVPRGYLTNVSFYDGMDETKILHAKTLSQRVYLDEGRLNFEYILELNLEAKDDRVIVFEIFDHEGFFKFKISSDEHFALDNGIYVMPNVNLPGGIALKIMRLVAIAVRYQSRIGSDSLVEGGIVAWNC